MSSACICIYIRPGTTSQDDVPFRILSKLMGIRPKMKTRALNSRTETVGPTKTEWESHRARIIYMCLVNGLDVVIGVMQSNRSFHAR